MCSALAALGMLSSTEYAFAASATALVGSVRGMVSDSAGRPQPGVSVELLYAD